MTQLGDTIELVNQTVEVVDCDECDHLMVNIDADEIRPGDLLTLKRAGLRLSNPETEEEICLNCEYNKPTFGQKLSSWFESSNDDNNDDSFFHSTPSISTPSFGGSSFGEGFGGFGGGSFSGGGASRSF